jgi:hypothetical protein
VADVESLGSGGSVAVGEWLQPGSVSADGTAIVGQDNRLFLLGGSNDYHQAYHQEENEAVEQAEGWLNYAAAALSACNNVTSQFLFSIVPNKATILADRYPLSIADGITPRLRRILQVNKTFIHSPVELMRAGGEWFRRNDTHFTYAGNIAYVNDLMRELGLDVELSISDETHTAEHNGDLGGKFDPPMKEALLLPAAFPDTGKIYNLGDPARRHTGSMFATCNRNYLVDKTLMVFGNSFSEAAVSWGMSPYFAHIFKRYFFHWGNEVDANLVQQLRPDIVVLQTCERFLSTPPKRLYPELSDLSVWPGS